ncbi:MAG: hypothetical protein IT430_10765 [Phycisphaerales bacterium]|nr:hypothetical protein [Phycisphaerales bacterium]
MEHRESNLPRRRTRSTRKTFTLLAPCIAALGGFVLVLAACEHAKHWRGGEPYDRAFIARMADPAEAQSELDGRMQRTPEDAPPRPDGSGPYSAEDWSLEQSGGCMTCHGEYDKASRTMHGNTRSPMPVGCSGCHGGDPSVTSPLDSPGRPGEPGTPITDPAYLDAMQRAHVQPRNAQAWYGRHDDAEFGSHHGESDPAMLHGSRNPEITGALLNQESPEFIRFINPGDLRVAEYSCGSCHFEIVEKVKRSMMAHGAQLWGAALYNNGSIPNKTPNYGESYSAFGLPQRLQGVIEIEDDQVRTRPVSEEEAARGVAPYLSPLPVWNISQPGNILRIFERGTKLPAPGGATPNASPAEIGNPNPLVEGGRPDKGLSPRGLGTANRTDPVFIGLQKTRLLDPTLNFLGTNDHPGDYRSSGCTTCHVLYANDRDPMHSGAMLAAHGNMGLAAAQSDPNIPTDESGHPVSHVLSRAIPSSQCITCHVHPGTSYANTYLGYMWWDNESDGEFFYPNRSHAPTPEQEIAALRRNPESAALNGLWANLYPNAVSHAGELSGDDFLERSGEPRKGDGSTLNDRLQHNQIADFHGHGWVFRAVYKKDRQGHLLDENDHVVDFNDPDKWDKAVRLGDVHLKAGMHCIDCHFEQDVHGDGRLYGEVRNAIEITCIDCHGTYTDEPTLRTSGPAAVDGGRDLSRERIFGQPRIRKRGRIYVQQSATDRNLSWTIPLTKDTIDPDSAWAKENPEAAARSRRAKTMRRDGSWGDLTVEEGRNLEFAHSPDNMECYTCHTSWMTSCFGCHLPMEANQRAPMLHNENLFTRNYTRYNYQVLRDDIFMLGRDSSVKGGRVVPVRSSSAVIVSSQNANREWIYHQQQTISAEGFSGQAFNPHFPHATSGRGTTKMCTDCHVSQDNDNNAWMAQLLLQGTNFVNFIGRYAYVATGGDGLEAVAVTEHDEPQAVYGSHLHHLAYPDEHRQFVDGGRALREAHHHGAPWGGEILDVQLRGEYLYTARGAGGFYAYDVANIDNKGFSERIVTAPVSPLGQNLGFDTSYAVAIASPTTLGVDPARSRLSNDPEKPRKTMLDERAPEDTHLVNQEQPIHPLYAYLYIGDRDEGLILTFAGTLLDGDPTNNFMQRATLADGATAFNPDGVLTGMTHLALAGHYVYATAPAGLVVIDIDQPLSPRVVAVVGSDVFESPQSVAVQFRYAFVTDARGLHALDITDPLAPRVVEGGFVELAEAHRVYVARTYAFVAAGSQGLAIIDVTNPEQPRLDQIFSAAGAIDDARDVKVGMTNASLFAYVADGRNGLRVIELMGPHSTPQFRGFSPPLNPSLIATYHTHGPALAVSKGLDRDRAVDESGNQVAVFGRLGARPLNLEEMQQMYLRDGEVFKVSDEPAPDETPREFARPKAKSP